MKGIEIAKNRFKIKLETSIQMSMLKTFFWEFLIPNIKNSCKFLPNGNDFLIFGFF